METIIKDAAYYKRLRDLDDAMKAARSIRAAGPEPLSAVPDYTEPEAPASSYAHVEPVPQQWVWPDLIPAGRLTVVAGAGGTRKGFWATDLIARVSRGDMMGDYSPGPLAGSVVCVTAEDDPNTAMAYRLRAAGADLSKVHDCTNPGGVPFLLPDNISDLSALCAELGDVRLIYIDPLSAVTSVALSSNVTVRRRITNPLEALAADTGAAVVLMHHTTKAGVIAGSKGLVDACRSVLRISVDPARPAVRILEQEKSNIAGEVEPIRFTTIGEWPDIKVSYLPSVASTESTAEAVLGVLGLYGPLTPQDVAAKTATSCKEIMITLMRLSREGKVSSPSRGLYAAQAA